MKLADLRRLTIRNGSRIYFSLSNGMECVVNEHGIADVPALQQPGGFNLEEELGRAAEFRLESAAPAEKNKSRPQILNRDQLADLVQSKTAEKPAEEHED